MNVLPACMSVYHMHVSCLRKSGKGFRSPGTIATMWVLGIECGSSERTPSAIEPSLSLKCMCVAQAILKLVILLPLQHILLEGTITVSFDKHQRLEITRAEIPLSYKERENYPAKFIGFVPT